MLVFSPDDSNRHTPPASDRPEVAFHINHYNSHIIRSAGSRHVDMHGLPAADQPDAERRD